MRISSAAMLTLCAFSALYGGAARAQDPAASDAATAPAGAIQIALPFNKAIVRESVPVRLRDFPDNGYVSVSIDDRFVTAKALPRRRTDPVYIWDTKATYTVASAPTEPISYPDGAHAITISVFNDQNKPVGKDTVVVQLANKINLPASQGIALSYPWKTNLSLRYQRRTTLTAAPTDGTDPEQTIQQSLLRYRRTVENTTGGTYLIRDEALPVDKSARPTPFVSYVATRGITYPLQNGFDIRARYRVVDTRGHVLSEVGTQNGGEQLAFSLPVLPPRRVSVGAHWESPVKVTLDWTSPYPTSILATSTLEDFEWQDRYPTVKIRETYTGPANFIPRPGSPLPQIQSQNIKFERVIYFAYNAGRVVRMETTMTLTTTTPGLLVSAAAVGFPGGPGQSSYGPVGQSGIGRGGASYPGYPGGSTGRGGASYPGYPGGSTGRGRSPSPQYPGSNQSPGGNQYPGGMMGGGSQYPGGMMGGQTYPGQNGVSAAEPVPVRLKYTETSVILI